MKIGEAVEKLIYLRDKTSLNRQDDEAVCYACNILDLFPRMMEASEVRAILAGEDYAGKRESTKEKII